MHLISDALKVKILLPKYNSYRWLSLSPVIDLLLFYSSITFGCNKCLKLFFSSERKGERKEYNLMLLVNTLLTNHDTWLHFQHCPDISMVTRKHNKASSYSRRVCRATSTYTHTRTHILISQLRTLLLIFGPSSSFNRTTPVYMSRDTSELTTTGFTVKAAMKNYRVSEWRL